MSRPVPFVDLARQHASLDGEITAAVTAVIDRGDFILGEAVERFERDFAAYVGAEQAIGVGSGTAAITIAVAAAGVSPGAEVIVPAHTYIASALGVLHAGARPVFCEVDPDTGLIDPAAAEATIGPDCEAILAVHLYGQVCDPQPLERLAARHGIAVIEDAAQAHGARWQGRGAGSLGRASAFSFYPSKNLGALGDGGIVCTSDSGLADRARRLRNLGQLAKSDHQLVGFNERLDTLQAAALAVKLPHLDGWNQSRREAAALYRGRLAGKLAILPERDGATDVYHLYPVRVPNRAELATELSERGISTGVHYTPALHQQPPFRGESGRAGEFPAAEAWAAQELSLPMFGLIEPAEVDAVCDALEAALAAGS